MTNPFDDTDGVFLVVVNHDNQHSLWPEFIPTPPGWDQVFGPAGHAECLHYVDENWHDMRPASLVAAMGSMTSRHTSLSGPNEGLQSGTT